MILKPFLCTAYTRRRQYALWLDAQHEKRCLSLFNTLEQGYISDYPVIKMSKFHSLDFNN